MDYVTETICFIQNLWNESPQFNGWQSIYISLFFMFCNVVLFFSLWFVSRWLIVEYGYPKRKNKYIKKISKDFTVIDHILLIKFVRCSENKGFFLYLTLAMHCMNICFFISAFIGFFGCVFSGGIGWSLVLLIFSMLCALIISTLILFIPQLIFVPAIRNQYK